MNTAPSFCITRSPRCVSVKHSRRRWCRVFSRPNHTPRSWCPATRFVLTRFDDGLTDDHVPQLIAALNWRAW